MPVPKRKTSKSRRDRRSSCKFIRPQDITKCSNCDQALNTHQACFNCGFYKGRKIMATKLDKAVQQVQAKASNVKEESQESQER